VKARISHQHAPIVPSLIQPYLERKMGREIYFYNEGR
jgi:hypothetical protein